MLYLHKFRTLSRHCFTLREQSVLNLCWHQWGWPWMTLNARFIFKCEFRTTRLTFVSCGFQNWQNVTEWTWALTVSDKNVACRFCRFWAKEVCINFCGDLLHRKRRTEVEPLKSAIFHLMQRHFPVRPYPEIHVCGPDRHAQLTRCFSAVAQLLVNGYNDWFLLHVYKISTSVITEWPTLFHL